MFSRLWNFIRSVVRKILPYRAIESIEDVESPLSTDMVNALDDWYNLYLNRAEWLSDTVKSLNLPAFISSEIARQIVLEMKWNITGKSADGETQEADGGDVMNPRAEYLKKEFERCIATLRLKLEQGCAAGGMTIKPYPKDGHIYFDWTMDWSLYPIAFDDDGNLADVIFRDTYTEGKTIFTRLERHTLTDRGLTITNTAYVSAVSDMLGREIPLSSVEEWKDYAPAVTFPIDRMIFGQFSVPLDNTIDDDPNGVSIFEDGIELIKKADIQFGRLDYEFQSAERKIHADLSTVKPDGKGNYHLPEVYVDVSGDKEDFYQEFSPALRQEGFIAGLEEIRRGIEFAVGLAYGDLSHPQYVEKTATEVNAAKIRKRNTVDKLQEQLRLCLEDFVFAMAFYNRMTKSGYEFACDFKDSILNDEQSEREEDRKDLANGTLRPEEYRAKYRGETIDEAKANLPASAEVD